MFDSTFLANDKSAEGSKIDDGCISNINFTHPTERDFSKVKSIAQVAVVSSPDLITRRCEMEKTLRFLFDRRSGDDRRKIFNRGYFRSGGDERRIAKERRSTGERRKDWRRVTVWSSAFRGLLGHD